MRQSDLPERRVFIYKVVFQTKLKDFAFLAWTLHNTHGSSKTNVNVREKR